MILFWISLRDYSRDFRSADVRKAPVSHEIVNSYKILSLNLSAYDTVTVLFLPFVYSCPSPP